MTSSDSVISVANQALLSIGSRSTISALNEGSTEAKAVSVLFKPTYEMLARSAPWNCFRQQATLTLLAAAEGTPENPDGDTLPLPPSPWLYQYALPSNCLQVRFLLCSLPSSSTTGIPATSVNNAAATMIPGQGQIPYAVAYATDTANNPINVILTNQTQAQCVFTVNQPNPVIWDSLFRQAFVSSLAAFLVPALSLNLQLMNASIKTADAIIHQARVRDGNEGVTSMNRQADWIVARAAGTTVWGAQTAPWLSGDYIGMAWPAV